MNTFLLITKTELKDSITSKWFWLYALVFGGAVIVLFLTGITESQIMGFTGISRLLLTYFQLCVVVLPIFILMTTVRSIVGDKESSVLEYFLSMPVSFSNFFWGKIAGRFIVILVPILAAMLLAALWAGIKGLNIDLKIFITYCCLLVSMSWCFLGIGMLISSLVNRQETGLGIAFFSWLILVLFIDIVLIGVFLQKQVNPELIISIALLNPLQDFRVASMALFDPDLTMLGPASWFILDHFGKTGFILFGIAYPLALGFLTAFSGYLVFSRRDIL
ncbi:MAG: ABC transporter permease subunit [Nitrospirae bacterium]|nr:ABC transporter permease subunit [Nitrospirota bacterium]